MKQFLEAGKAVTTHGVAGEVKIMPMCDSAEVLCTLKRLFTDSEGKHLLKVASVRVHKNMALIRFDGVDSIDDARVLVERIFYLDRNDLKLPKGSYFIEDLLGAAVIDANTGEEYGEICDITSPANRDIYHVKLKSGDVRMIPAVQDFVTKTVVGQDGAAVYIRPIGGLLHDED